MTFPRPPGVTLARPEGFVSKALSTIIVSYSTGNPAAHRSSRTRSSGQVTPIARAQSSARLSTGTARGRQRREPREAAPALPGHTVLSSEKPAATAPQAVVADWQWPSLQRVQIWLRCPIDVFDSQENYVWVAFVEVFFRFLRILPVAPFVSHYQSRRLGRCPSCFEFLEPPQKIPHERPPG